MKRSDFAPVIVVAGMLALLLFALAGVAGAEPCAELPRDGSSDECGMARAARGRLQTARESAAVTPRPLGNRDDVGAEIAAAPGKDGER